MAIEEMMMSGKRYTDVNRHRFLDARQLLEILLFVVHR